MPETSHSISWQNKWYPPAYIMGMSPYSLSRDRQRIPQVLLLIVSSSRFCGTSVTVLMKNLTTQITSLAQLP